MINSVLKDKVSASSTDISYNIYLKDKAKECKCMKQRECIVGDTYSHRLQT
jgi:hypothetical protein